MKSRKRAFQSNIIIHCYQRSADGGVLFYSYSDYLVWFTHLCIAAKRYKVTILAACPMPDHVHLSVSASSRKRLADFEQRWTGDFAREHNKVCHRNGPVFASPFGSSLKKTDKSARSNIIYVGNNPVERRLAEKAEDYRWTFLAYYNSPHPFSKPLIIRDSRWPLRKAVKEVKAQFKAGKPLSYALLKRLFKPLTNDECQQFTDFIINTYNVIDYEAAIRFFGSYEDMLMAMHSTTGSEYDLNEVFIGKSDLHFKKMTSIVMRELKPDDIHDILALDPIQKYEVFKLIRKGSEAMSEQIARFLHMKYKEWDREMDIIDSQSII